LSELFWKAEVERYKHDLQLAHTEDEDYEPYQAAVSKTRNKTRGGNGVSEEDEKKG